MAARFQPGLMYCEMVKMDALIRQIPRTLKMLAYDETMRPIGAQLVGSKIQIAKEAAKIIEDMGFDVLDFNCGCPVDKVTKDGSGSGMLKDPRRIGDILQEMRQAVSIPLTVKIRAGWTESEIVCKEVTKIAEQAGADAIAIHGRTRAQGYSGPANWGWIKECVEAANTIKVIGNGDVFSPEAAKRMLDETGCDAVLVSRGTMGAPWIVEDILRHFKGEAPLPRDFEYKKNMLQEHFEEILTFFPEEKALLDMRRVGCWYVHSARGVSAFRSKISHAKTMDEMRQVIQEVMDEPGE
jgi:nifR3 family TIM-barrel protein